MQGIRYQTPKIARIGAVAPRVLPLSVPPPSWPMDCSSASRNMGSRRELRDGRSAGFTLIELMITVTIIGVLALLATVGYARWIRTSKTAEATAMLGAIKSAQETFRAERLRYADVSVGNLDTHYPTSAPTDAKVAWNPAGCLSTPICAAFLTLNVQAESLVYYRYSTIAGAATGAPITYDGRTTPAANDPWFIAKARGNLNNDAVLSYYWITSFDTTISNVNADE